MKKKNPAVETFIRATVAWRRETEKLRAIALSSGLEEELKWGKPCYTSQGMNVLIIQGFKGRCALLFCKGALLKDSKGILEKPGPNTQGARRITFSRADEIDALAPTLKQYIDEAVAAEKSGREVNFKKSPEPMPVELAKKFRESPSVKAAFHALTPGRQRGYILHFTAAKQSPTRTARIEKCLPRILAGQGFHD